MQLMDMMRGTSIRSFSGSPFGSSRNVLSRLTCRRLVLSISGRARSVRYLKAGKRSASVSLPAISVT